MNECVEEEQVNELNVPSFSSILPIIISICNGLNNFFLPLPPTDHARYTSQILVLKKGESCTM